MPTCPITNTGLGPHTSLGAQKSAHTSLGEHTSAHMCLGAHMSRVLSESQKTILSNFFDPKN